MLAPRRASAVLSRTSRLCPCHATRPELAAYYSTEPALTREFSPRTLDKPVRAMPRSGIDAGKHSAGQEHSAKVNHSIYIKPWDGIKSMVEAFAVLRAVERNFGRLREYKFMHDGDLPENYQSYLAADFADREVWNSVPAGGAVIKVKIPPHDARQPGGIGLADVRSLLAPWSNPMSSANPQVPSWEAETDDEVSQAWKTVDVRIEPARNHFSYMGRAEPVFVTRNLKLAVGKNFMSWGGFAPTLPSSTSPAQKEPKETTASSEASLRPHMSHARAKWQVMVGDNYPVFTPQPAGHASEGAKASTRDAARQASSPGSHQRRTSAQQPAPPNSAPVAAEQRPEPKPVKPAEPTAAQLADRERRQQLREAWAQFSYPMPGMGAATASAASSASALQQSSATPAHPVPTAPKIPPGEQTRKETSRKERLLQKVEGKETELQQRSTMLRKEESEAVEDEKSLSRRLVDLFGRW